MKKKPLKELPKAIFLMVFVALILFSGCENSSMARHEVYDFDVYSGTKGLTAEFMKESPPEQVFENNQSAIGVEIRNKGASDIKKGFVSLVKEDDYMDVVNWQAFNPITSKLGRFSIEGKSKFNHEGGFDKGMIYMIAKPLGDMTETHTAYIGLNFCYDYKTTYTDSVCIDTDPFEVSEKEKPCEVKDLSPGGGQGAPVEITRVFVTMATAKPGLITPRFKVYVANAGHGEVIAKGKIREACTSGQLDYKDLNKIEVENATLGEYNLKCRPKIVYLKDDGDENFFVCELDQGLDKTKGAFKSVFSVSIGYGYTETISTETEVRKFKEH